MSIRAARRKAGRFPAPRTGRDGNSATILRADVPGHVAGGAKPARTVEPLPPADPSRLFRATEANGNSVSVPSIGAFEERCVPSS